MGDQVCGYILTGSAVSTRYVSSSSVPSVCVCVCVCVCVQEKCGNKLNFEPLLPSPLLSLSLLFCPPLSPPVFLSPFSLPLSPPFSPSFLRLSPSLLSLSPSLHSSTNGRRIDSLCKRQSDDNTGPWRWLAAREERTRRGICSPVLRQYQWITPSISILVF